MGRVTMTTRKEKILVKNIIRLIIYQKNLMIGLLPYGIKWNGRKNSNAQLARHHNRTTKRVILSKIKPVERYIKKI